MHLSDFHDTRTLTRGITKTCWWIILLYLAATVCYSFLTSYDQWKFLRVVTLVPGVKLIALLAFLELYYRRTTRFLEYIAIIVVNGLISIMILSLYELPIAIYLLIYPVLISLFYYSQRLIIFALVQSLITLTIVIFSSPVYSTLMGSSALFMVVVMQLSTALIINNLRIRATALTNHLVKVTQEKQDLQTKNILMEKMNRVDPATGLYNHRSFHEHLDSIMALQTSFGFAVHLALLDIDSFKQVNDTYGHASGDAVIIFVADRMKSQLEPDDFASRYGGEEFAILSVEKSSEMFYCQLESIRAEIEAQEHAVLNGKRVTISIGLQTLLPGMSKEQLFGGADAALYRAKRTGKNRIVVAEGPISAASVT
jgi:diguanylate cyclase (GGDEF)-like protein